MGTCDSEEIIEEKPRNRNLADGVLGRRRTEVGEGKKEGERREEGREGGSEESVRKDKEECGDGRLHFNFLSTLNCAAHVSAKDALPPIFQLGIYWPS